MDQSESRNCPGALAEAIASGAMGAENGETQSKTRAPGIRIEASRRWAVPKLGELWEYRELLYFLVWRDVKVRYKQAVLGAAWTIIQPIVTMLVFTVIFSHFARMPSDGIPYPLFVYAALVPWTYFASAVNRSGNCLLSDANLIEKVYFPRVILPLSAVTTPLVDFFFGFLVLTGVIFWFGVVPNSNILLLPIFIVLAMLTALAAGVWLGSLNVRYRDIGHAVPFVVQIWLYACPVAYPIKLIPDGWRLLYSLNPMVGVIEGFRWALLGAVAPNYEAMAIGTGVVFLVLLSGLVYFRRIEKTFADVI